MPTIDYSALTESVKFQDVKTFRRDNPPRGATVRWQTFIVLVFFFIAAGGLFFSIPVSFIVSSPQNPERAITVLIIFVFVIVAIVFFFIYAARSKWTQWYRLSRFSQANGLTFSVDGSVPPYPGMIFGIGSQRNVPSRISRLSPPFFDLGNLKYTTGSGKNRQVHRWSYIALKLNRMVPNMILDAKSNNFLWTNLPRTFSRDQVLSLEGDFDKHFTLYCPREYERDALYVFTPDLMTRLIDYAAGFDIELIDDWMFLYSAAPLNFRNVTAVQRMFDVVDVVGSKTLTQTERYADARVVDQPVPLVPGNPISSRMSFNTVATQGRRLKRSVPVVFLFIGIVVVGMWMLNFGSTVLAVFFGS